MTVAIDVEGNAILFGIANFDHIDSFEIDDFGADILNSRLPFFDNEPKHVINGRSETLQKFFCYVCTLRFRLLRKSVVFPPSLRMPLNTDNETPGCILNCLDNTVGRKRYGSQIPPDLLDRLVMIAVDLGVRAAGKPADQTILRNSHDVPRRR